MKSNQKDISRGEDNRTHAAHRCLLITVLVFGAVLLSHDRASCQENVEKSNSSSTTGMSQESLLRAELAEIHFANEEAVDSYDLCVQTQVIDKDSEGKESAFTRVKRVMRDAENNIDVVFFRIIPGQSVTDSDEETNHGDPLNSYAFCDGNRMIHRLADGRFTRREARPGTKDLFGGSGLRTYWGKAGIGTCALSGEYDHVTYSKLVSGLQTPMARVVARVDVDGNAVCGPNYKPEDTNLSGATWGESKYNSKFQVFDSYTSYLWARSDGKKYTLSEAETVWHEHAGIKLPVFELRQRKNQTTTSKAKWLRINSGIEDRFKTEIQPTSDDFDELLDFDSLVDISHPIE